MMALAMEFGWRRVAQPEGGGPAPVALSAAIAAGAVAALAALTVTAASTEQAETSALVARMTVQPGAARRSLIDQLVAGLKADGVWTRLDWLLLFAAHDAQAARLNWRAAKSAATVNAPPFTTDRGYAGDGASAYLDLGETLAASGNQYAVASATIGAWVLAAGTTAQPTVFGASNAGGAPYAAVNLSTAAAAGFVNSSGSATAGASGGTGHVAAVRAAANSTILYRDGAQAGTATAASTSVPTSTAMLLRLGGNYSTARVAAAYSGTALTGAQVTALHQRLATYLNAIGA